MAQPERWDSVRIEVRTDQRVRTLELHGTDAIPLVGVFDVEQHTRDMPSDGPWRAVEPTGTASVQLQVTGKVGPADRRTAQLAAEMNNGRPVAWLDLGPLLGGGYVCAVPAPEMPSGICGMPVESEPCDDHPPDRP